MKLPMGNLYILSEACLLYTSSVSVGWRVSEEQFMEWSKVFLSNLKLRGSSGNIGNQSIEPYAFIPGMDSPLANWVVNGQRCV